MVRAGQGIVVDVKWPKLSSAEAQVAFARAIDLAVRHDPKQLLKLLGLPRK